MTDEIAAVLRAAGMPEADALAEATALVSADPAQAFERAERRAAGEPLALILGTATFLGLELEVRHGVLAPRPETELLARAVIAHRPGVVVDLCCGAGNIACAIAAHLPDAHVHAADLSAAACALTADNARRHGLTIAVHGGDLFAALPESLRGTVDVIACNPPYISTGKLAGERAGLLRFEPREAFDAGPYGLAIHQRVLAGAPAWLRPGGWLLMEIGVGQRRQVEALIARASSFASVEFLADAAGAARAVAAQLQVQT